MQDADRESRGAISLKERMEEIAPLLRTLPNMVARGRQYRRECDEETWGGISYRGGFPIDSR